MFRSSRTKTQPRILALMAFAMLVGGCQSARYKEFESIHGGMTKGEVLAAMGNPKRTQRWHGRDRWEYVLYGHPEGDLVREIHFENGKSTYVGAAIKPAISADEQDRINDVKNREADVRDYRSPIEDTGKIEIQKFVPVEEERAGATP